MRVMRINSSIEVVNILTIAGSLFRLALPVVSAGSLGYTWLNLVIPGYTWLYLVIPGYTWLYLVILGYLMVILSGRDCRRFLQMTERIIEDAQTISHIFEF